mmetsp:Transcript_30498/g.55686  ORF Transcript_30498/g.55686 Transcript_30498/m.55686 type:complete len:117 (-) Transcript_30498:52-402(-)
MWEQDCRPAVATKFGLPAVERMPLFESSFPEPRRFSPKNRLLGGGERAGVRQIFHQVGTASAYMRLRMKAPESCWGVSSLAVEAGDKEAMLTNLWMHPLHHTQRPTSTATFKNACP